MVQNSAGLLLDIGNTATKWRFISEGCCTEGQILHQSTGPPDRFGLDENPSLILASRVTENPGADAILQHCKEVFGVDARLLKSQDNDFGVTNGYEDPAQLGVDRWLAMLAAWNLHHQPMVVVDCGTAMTMDLIDSAGVFRGGIIFPGPEVFLRVFEHSVPHLQIPSTMEVTFPPRNTANAIGLGAKWSGVAVVEKFVDNSAREIGEAPLLLVTGGGRHKLVAKIDYPAEIIGNLVLDGLQLNLQREIFQLN
ncbi:MAG: type III pantothenate kinase [Parasphingorhabdus sp.]|jgi:type III pantothenate kinase